MREIQNRGLRRRVAPSQLDALQALARALLLDADNK